jgi:uracil-DNA glycosylase
MKEIKSFLVSEISKWKVIYPNPRDIFNALNYCKFEDTKVVIIGQDPYHGPNQAHWLSFSVRDSVKVPPSLQNIYKELEDEFWIKKDFSNGNLENWTKQWVLLLNSVLSVEAWSPASHSKIWWQNFTDEIIKVVSSEKSWVVFLLWWAFAIGKKDLVDSTKHLVLTSPHPSPFSVHKWFFGNMHFLETNEYLEQNWKEWINWWS